MTLFPIKLIRRTACEILAYALQQTFPDVKLISGRTTDVGFYYDFLLEQPLTEEMLFMIEEHMRGVAKENVEIEMLEMMRQNAMEMFRHLNQPFKVAELKDCPDNIVQIWKMGKFCDVCEAPYAPNAGIAQAFKLQKVQRKTVSLPFYDKNEVKKYEQKQVIRVIGTACSNKQDLKDFLKKLDKHKKIDHQILGSSMGLFRFEDEAFHGSVFFLPKGQFVRDALLQLAGSKLNFLPVSTPNISKFSFLKKTLLDKKDLESKILPEMEVDGEVYVYFPNKPACHAILYQASIRETPDLPIRYFETAETHVTYDGQILNGLFETRSFLSDTGTIFCTDSQVVSELISCLQLIDETATILSLKYEFVLKGDKPKNSPIVESFDKSREWLEKALIEAGCQFIIDKESVNNYATHHKGINFHGPSVEVRYTDALGRQWQGSLLTIDLWTREALGLRYTDAAGRKQAPIMISRTIFSSLEQFIALLVESYSGNLPLWLSESEVRVLPIAERNAEYATKVLGLLIQSGFRASIDKQLSKLGEKIHAAENERIPYMLIVGDNEEKGGTVTVRACLQDTDRAGVELDSFLKQLREEHESGLPSQMRR
jgi:threonyl-tRNA synthetase